MIFFTLVSLQFDRTVSLSQSILMTMEHSNEKQLKVTSIIKRTIKIKRLCTTPRNAGILHMSSQPAKEMA